MMEKPGYKTTEAWVSVLSSVLLILVSYGLLTQAQADSLLGLIAPALPLVLSIVPAVVYVVQRTGLKKESVKAEAAQMAAKVEITRLETMAAMAAPASMAAYAAALPQQTAAPDMGQPQSLNAASSRRVIPKGSV